MAWAVYPRLAGSPPAGSGPAFWRRLPRAGVLIMVGAESTGGGTGWKPGRFPFSIKAMRPEDHWEGQPLPRLEQRLESRTVGHRHLWVMVTFGNLHPSATQLATAQAELDRLHLPGQGSA